MFLAGLDGSTPSLTVLKKNIYRSLTFALHSFILNNSSGLPDCGALLVGSGAAAIGTDLTTPNRDHGDKSQSYK